MDNEQTKCITKRITVYGIVQGVGFRPSVYRLAIQYRIKGTIRNVGGKVEIIAQAARQDLDDFYKDLNSKNNDYEIVSIAVEDIAQEEYIDFKIIDSGINDEIAIIPPDLPICDHCKNELFKESDRRYKNPFISCMTCGPRYTIIEKLPYDRHNTSMKEFPLCPSCQNEYTSPNSRRFHAQTISCNDCGPYLLFNKLGDNEAFDSAVEIIKSGGIIAVKGIGGYHLTCSPFLEETVSHLRKLKGREEKPFAVMFESIDSVREYCKISSDEKILLQSKARPIVLLSTTNKRMAESTNKGSLYCGAFLPYTPLQIMLIHECGPLIMTSANLSNKPIIKDDLEMLSMQSPYLKGVLYNKRKIIRSVDDSVAKIIENKPQVIRRSRGYVPYPIFIPEKNNLEIFAAGGDLKAAFCLYKKGNAVVSQYFGDLEERAVLDEYKNAIGDLVNQLKIHPNRAVCDLHPNYQSRKFTETLDIPLQYVQHHHAHIASVMAEHNLNEQVIGVAFDGTGYGTDGNIWGGEFLVCNGADFKRTAHLSYTPMIGGDSSMHDAKKTATCFLIKYGLEEYVRDERSNVIKAAINNNMNTVLSSSMGRLFDAVASVLEIQNENSYEGECAINLEKEAILAIKNHIKPVALSFAIKYEDDMIKMDPTPLLESICKQREDLDVGALALGFHYAVADAVLKICEAIRIEQKISVVALSGGVFQNTLLTERVLKILREHGFRVYINRAVPPNDGSISLGQIYIGLKR